MKTSHKVIQLREIMGLDQLEMSKRLGVSRNYVSMLERGREPSDTLAMFIDSLWKKHGGADNSTESDLPGNPTEWDLTKLPTESEASVLQKPFGRGRDLLKRAREAKGLSQKQLADKVGYSLAIYQDIEECRSNMGSKMAKKVAEILGVDVDDLLGGCDEPPSNGTAYGTVGAIPPIKLPPGSKARYVPLLSLAQCGSMGAYDDGAYDHTGFLVIDPKDSKAFAVKSVGESMIPAISPGDAVVIYPSYTPKNNGLVLARLNDDHGSDVMIKLYQATQDQVTLISYNPLFPPLTYPRDAFSWIYPVAQVSKVYLE